MLPLQEDAIGWLLLRGLPVGRAEDLVGDAVLVCARKKKRPPDPERFFWRVLGNLLNKYLRDEAGRTEPLLEEPAAPGPTPLDHAAQVELREEVEEVLAGMRPEVAAVARLRLAGLTSAAAARALGLPSSTARGYWAEAKGPLRELANRLRLKE